MKNTFPIILTLTAFVLTACPSTPNEPNTTVSTGNNTETTPAPDTTKPSIGNLEISNGKLSVTASDSSGIKKVEFYREASNLKASDLKAVAVAPTPFFVDSSAPYEYEFDAADNGQFNFYVKVFDQKDNVETSTKTNATIQLADTKAPAKPVMTLNKTTFSSGEILNVSVGNISDNLEVTRVELVQVDTEDYVLQSATAAPFAFERTMSCNRIKKTLALQRAATPVAEPAAPVAPAVTSQSKILKLVAYDAAGNSSASDPQTVTVNCNDEAALP